MSEFVKLGDAAKQVAGIVTRKKYEHLKKFINTISAEEKKMVQDYEEFQKLQIIEIPKKEVVEQVLIESLPGEVVFKNFINCWKFVHKKDFQITDQNKKILFALCQYFGKDPKCKLDLNKGILLTGDCGVGKTSMMRVFHEMGKDLAVKQNDKFMWFTMINCNELVTEFENKETDADTFHKTYKKGNRYFDDFGTEREASKYGKSNIMQEILENRYLNLDFKTHLTTNLNDEEIRDKYGFRVYDRLFEQFNYIELTGESFRRK